MVTTTGDDSTPTAEFDSAQTSKVGTPPFKKPTLLEILQADDQEERSDTELSPRANRDNDDAMKYGFGAGMRMYAKSLAMAEKQEAASVPVVKKVSPMVHKEPIVIKPPTPTAPVPPAVSPTGPTSTAVSPTNASPTDASPTHASPTNASPKAPTPKAPTPKALTPKVPTPKAQTPNPPTLKEEPAPGESPAEHEEVVAVDPPTAEEEKPATVVQTKAVSVPASAEEVAALPDKSIACGSIFQQIQDAIGELFRKTEDCVDDAHEHVCNRETTCASTAMKNVASDDVAGEMVESTNGGAAKVGMQEAAVAKEEEATPSA
jgi:hypothetical protein